MSSEVLSTSLQVKTLVEEVAVLKQTVAALSQPQQKASAVEDPASAEASAVEASEEATSLKSLTVPSAGKPEINPSPAGSVQAVKIF